MKALLVEHGQATREVTKTETDNIFAEGLYDLQREVAFQRVSWWLFALHFHLQARNISR